MSFIMQLYSLNTKKMYLHFQNAGWSGGMDRPFCDGVDGLS